jgi:hypothetical protein
MSGAVSHDAQTKGLYPSGELYRQENFVVKNKNTGIYPTNVQNVNNMKFEFP